MSTQPQGGDLTAISGSQTDVAPLGRDQPPPAHERPAGTSSVDWNGIAATPEYQELVATKRRFIVRASVFFIIYYFLLPIGVGWAPALMKREVLGKANLAYVFGFSQFIMAWILAAIYVKVAAGWDRRSADLLAKLGSH